MPSGWTGVIALGAAAAVLVGGCGADPDDSGAPVEESAPAPADPASPGDDASGEDGDETAPVVDRGDWEDNPKVEAAAQFYEELWESYSQGEVTPALDSVMTGEAAQVFPDQIADKAEQGRILNTLQASVVNLKQRTVNVCMASSSYQDLDADTGAPVEQAEEGFTVYQVDVVKTADSWQVEATQGMSGSPCGEGR